MGQINRKLYDQKVNELLAEFDFEKVFDVMCYLKWTWEDEGVPSIDKMKKWALEYFNRCFIYIEQGENASIGSGGFMCHAELLDGDIFLSMEFVLTSWETF